MCQVDHSAGRSVLGSIDNQLEGNLHLVGDVLTADLVFAEAEGAAFFGALGALAPANGSNTISFMLARTVAESAALFLILVASQRGTSSSAI